MNPIFWKDVMPQDGFWFIAISEYTQNRLLKKPVCLYAWIPDSES